MANPEVVFNGMLSLLWWLFLFFWGPLYSRVNLYQGTHVYPLPWIWLSHSASNISTYHNLWYQCNSVHLSVKNGFRGIHYSSPRTKIFSRHGVWYTNRWHWDSKMDIPHRGHYSHHPRLFLPRPQCLHLLSEPSTTFQCSRRIHWYLHYWWQVCYSLLGH